MQRIVRSKTSPDRVYLEACEVDSNNCVMQVKGDSKSGKVKMSTSKCYPTTVDAKLKCGALKAALAAKEYEDGSSYRGKSVTYSAVNAEIEKLHTAYLEAAAKAAAAKVVAKEKEAAKAAKEKERKAAKAAKEREAAKAAKDKERKAAKAAKDKERKAAKAAKAKEAAVAAKAKAKKDAAKAKAKIEKEAAQAAKDAASLQKQAAEAQVLAKELAKQKKLVAKASAKAVADATPDKTGGSKRSRSTKAADATEEDPKPLRAPKAKMVRA